MAEELLEFENRMSRLATSVGLGMVTGLRTFQGLSWVSRELAGRRRRGRRTPASWLARDDVALALTVMALGELAVDKLPGIPDRVDAPPLVGRAVVGAVVGAVSAGRDRTLAGAALGAGGALLGAYAGWFFRREIGRVTLLPDVVVAMAEDALTMALARRLVAGLRG